MSTFRPIDTKTAPALHLGLPYTVEALEIPDGTEEWSVLCGSNYVVEAVVMAPEHWDAFRRLVHCRNLIDGVDEDTPPDALERDLLVLSAEINDHLARRIVSRFDQGFASPEDAVTVVRDLIATAWERTEDGSHA